MKRPTERKSVLAQIRNPLVFFALALLVIESIISLVATFSQITAQQQFYTVLLMAFLFLCVVVLVALITIRWPKHLYEQIAEDLDTLKQIEEFMNSAGLADVVRDLTIGTCTNYKMQKKEEE